LRVDQHNGVPPYLETRRYVARIINDYNRKKLAQEKARRAQTATAKVKPQKAPGTPPGPPQEPNPLASPNTVTKAETFHQQ